MSKEKEEQKPLLKILPCDDLLVNCSNDNPTIRILALGVSSNGVIVDKSKVNKPTLIGVHGSHSNSTLLASLRSGSPGKTLNLRLPARLIALDINNDGIVELKPAAHQGRKNHLKRIERTAMEANKHRKIPAVNVKDQLAVIAIVLIDRALSLTKETEELAKVLDSDIRNLIGLIIGQLDAGLKMLADRGELISGIGGGGLLIGCADLSQNLFVHANLQYKVINY